MPHYYPVMLDVRGRPALVVGGNRVAAEKAAALAASGALVTVMSDDFCEELLSMEAQSKITLRRKAYIEGDLEGAFVIVAATNDPRLIDAIWSETQRRGQLVNIVDVPARCSFIVPSILRRDQLTIAVSTEGASPSLARRIRQNLEYLFPPAYGAYLRLAAVARKYLRQAQVSYERRDEFFGDFFESDILGFLIEGHEAAALDATLDLLHQFGVEIVRGDLAKAFQESKAAG